MRVEGFGCAHLAVLAGLSRPWLVCAPTPREAEEAGTPPKRRWPRDEVCVPGDGHQVVRFSADMSKPASSARLRRRRIVAGATSRALAAPRTLASPPADAM